MRILLIFAILSMLSCVKELPGLPENLLADESVVLFSLEEVVFSFYSISEKNVLVRFSSIYDDLSPGQKFRIKNIAVSGSASYEMDIDQNFFIDMAVPVGSNVCYSLAFKANDGQKSRGTTFCFVVE